MRYRLAAEKGHTVAQWRLGELLELLASQTSFLLPAACA